MAIPVMGQTSENQLDFDRDFYIIIDNDVFTSLYRDQYYTSGLFGYFRKSKWTDENTKLAINYGISQRIYTPQFLSWRRVTSLDRPYAGTLSFEFGGEWYHQNKRYFKLHSEWGVIGPASGVSKLHQAWHRVLGLIEPQSWQFEIGNMPIVNIYSTYAKSLMDHANLDVITESNLALGTLFNQLRQELTVRMGRIKPLNQSVHYGGTLLEKNMSFVGLREIYFFVSPGIEYNIYNSTIEGGLLSGEEKHTEIPANWIFQAKSGIMLSWSRFDWRVHHYVRTKETREANYHTYVGMHLNYRF